MLEWYEFILDGMKARAATVAADRCRKRTAAKIRSVKQTDVISGSQTALQLRVFTAD
jgi:hypothetical protein